MTRSEQLRAAAFLVRTYRESVELAELIDPGRDLKGLNERDRLTVSCLTRIYHGADEGYRYLTGKAVQEAGQR
jgi:hypothetical protein